MAVSVTECDDGFPFDNKGCKSDCSGVLNWWKCDNVGVIDKEIPANCSLVGFIAELDTL